ncbi:DEKNAAC102839 [Brettanomyces naardenensis]|uniref:DEKNAAC102839 n=1 Tax=Brettanomyces naardenensis TaxID=13370 RepID=A0A448YLR9_BRENA|nr:DEKNAAC102839 [Brettanomyces naardenensis]
MFRYSKGLRGLHGLEGLTLANSRAVPMTHRLIASFAIQHRHHFIPGIRPIAASRSFSTAPLLMESEKVNTSEKAPKLEGEAEKAVTPSSAAATTPTVAPAAPASPKPPLMQRIKKEAQHYWDGTKLLGMEIKVSCRLLVKMGTGYELTRREYRLLQKTTGDVLRLFPFAFFVIVPFAELLLPVALKLFPNLLPSTYESKLDREKKLTLLRNTRMKVSHVLRTSKQKVQLPSDLSDLQRANFKDFMEKFNSGRAEEISKDQLINVAKLFNDDLILDNSSRSILTAMAKFMNLRPYGSDQILRYRIRHKMLKIKADDMLIDYEGVNNLSTQELQVACASRGIRSYTATPEQMKKWLDNWLQLRLHDKLPSTLAILVNAYSYEEAEVASDQYESLKTILSALPVEFYHAQELHVDSENATFKQRINVLKEQENLIRAESAQDKDNVVLVKDKLNLEDAGEVQKRVGKQLEKEAEEGRKEKEKKKEEEKKVVEEATK